MHQLLSRQKQFINVRAQRPHKHKTKGKGGSRHHGLLDPHVYMVLWGPDQSNMGKYVHEEELGSPVWCNTLPIGVA